MNSSVASAGAELRIVCGPTAAGKSALALRLAERRGLEIISADSRQIYRRFDIGTAKPSAGDRARVRHHGIDVADPSERWSAVRWAEDCRRSLADIGAAGALVVGGTGLYLRALVAPLFAAPSLDPDRSRTLEVQLDAMPIEELRRWVRTLDPSRAHLGRSQLIRAAQVALLTGARLSDLHRANARPRAFRARWLVVDPGEGLAARITARVDGMFAAGWEEEVRRLDAQVDAQAPAWQACGYRSVRSLVRGATDAREAREAIIIATRQYAKRQRTWFRHQLADGGDSITAVNPHEPGCDAVVDHWWSSGDPA
jgi:tRNA dimethylallyltransferase